MTGLLFTVLSLLVVDPHLCSALDSDAVAVADGLSAALIKIFPSKPEPLVKQAVADGLVKALREESLDASEVICIRDYTQLCPSGWTDAGDGSTCHAPKEYSGKCKPKLAWGGLTSQQKRQQASSCAATFPCLGQCVQDLASASCPQGWIQDINGDCLAPVGYSGRCVLRKSFSGMKQTEKKAWAQACDVSWPCRKVSHDIREIDRRRAEDCVMDFDRSCPDNYQLSDEGGSCIAQSEGSAGLCGLELSSKYSQVEKASYAKACNVAWPCASS